MSSLNFDRLDRSIDRLRRRLQDLERERDKWAMERERLERKLQALETEVMRLSDADRHAASLRNENEQYKKSQAIVRDQVVKMLDRIQTIEQ